MEKKAPYLIASLCFFIITICSYERIDDLLRFNTPYYFALCIPIFIYALYCLAVFSFFIPSKTIRFSLLGALFITIGVLSYVGFFICAPGLLMLYAKEETSNATPPSPPSSNKNHINLALFLYGCSISVFFGGWVLFALKLSPMNFSIWRISEWLLLFFGILFFTWLQLPRKKSKQISRKRSKNRKTRQGTKYLPGYSVYLVLMQIQSFLLITLFNSYKIHFWQWIFILLLLFPRETIEQFSHKVLQCIHKHSIGVQI